MFIQIDETTQSRLQALAQAKGISVEALVQEQLNKLVEEKAPEPFSSIEWGTTYRRLLEAVSDAVIAIDMDSRIIFFNQGAEKVFDYTTAEVLGQPLNILIPHRSREKHESLIKEFQTGEEGYKIGSRQLIQGLRKDGSLFPIETVILKATNEGQEIYTVVLQVVVEDGSYHRLLNETRERLQMLTDYTSDVIALHYTDGRFAYINFAAERVYGYSPQQMLNQNALDYIHPDDQPMMTQALEKVLNERTLSDVVYKLRCADGRYIWLQSHASVIPNDDGSVKYIITVSRDISALKKVEQELRDERDLQRSIMEASPSGIVVVEASGQMSYQNQRASEILGLPKSETESRTYDDVQWRHTDYDGNPWPDEAQPFVRVMKTKQPVWDVRHAIEWTNGHKVYLAINGMPILEDGEVKRVVFTIEDYTLRKLQQDELVNALERERRLNEIKSAFVSMVSHEFRTPMAIIMTSTSILRLHLNKLEPSAIIDRLVRIEKQIKQLNHLISDVTFINKSEIVGLTATPSRVDLPQFFQGLIAEMQSIFPKVNVMIETPPCEVLIDETLFYQIMSNLINNAMKYSPEGGQIEIVYICSDTLLNVEIEDHGIGIPEEEQVNLFNTFWRASNVGMISGTGLGLAIVKRAVDTLRGFISVESHKDRGTRFTVSIPLDSSS